MEALLKIDSKINLNSISSDVVASSPSRSLNEVSEEFRRQLLSYTSSDTALELIAEGAALKQAKGVKKSMAPGVDGFTI